MAGIGEGKLKSGNTLLSIMKDAAAVLRRTGHPAKLTDVAEAMDR